MPLRPAQRLNGFNDNGKKSATKHNASDQILSKYRTDNAINELKSNNLSINATQSTSTIAYKPYGE